MSQPYKLPAPCQRCGSEDGTLLPGELHQRLNCARCGTYIKFVSKKELGLDPRPVAKREPISASLRALILERATGRCELCGAGGLLHVGHILSRADGEAEGLSPAQLDSEENLCALCEACNLGFGRRSLPLRLAVAILRRRTAR
jgi:ribosomal protein S14